MYHGYKVDNYVCQIPFIYMSIYFIYVAIHIAINIEKFVIPNFSNFSIILTSFFTTFFNQTFVA